jgi:hypothetical protein
MKAITLRNLPRPLAQRIEEESARQGTSLNKTIIRLLEQALLEDGQQHQPSHHDLDQLAGSWSQEDADAFDRNLRKQRNVDEDLWK